MNLHIVYRKIEAKTRNFVDVWLFIKKTKEARITEDGDRWERQAPVRVVVGAIGGLVVVLFFFLQRQSEKDEDGEVSGG